MGTNKTSPIASQIESDIKISSRI